MPNTRTILPDNLNRLQSMAAAAGPAGLGVGLGLALVMGGSEQFFQAYLYGYLLWFGLATGSLALLMIHHMTGGAWSFVTQRILEACTRTLPLLALLFLPILAGPLTGLHSLYDAWVYPENEVVAGKAEYLNPWFWTGRAVAYFAVWGVIAYLFNRWSKILDNDGDPRIVLKFRRLAPVGLIIYCVTMTFAATDWAMSLEPEWFSTIYGPLFWISQALAVLAFSIIILSFLAEQKPLSTYISIEHYHHLGNLLLAFVVLWAYMSFSQYLITWSGNLPEEIHWYMHRSGGGLTALSLCLMAFHFFVPMMVLLFRRNKRHVSYLRRICYWILFWRLVDVFWLINPAFHSQAPGIYATDLLVYLAVFVGLGGVWLWAFFQQLKKSSLLPLNDPRLYDAVGQERVEGLEHA